MYFFPSILTYHFNRTKHIYTSLSSSTVLIKNFVRTQESKHLTTASIKRIFSTVAFALLYILHCTSMTLFTYNLMQSFLYNFVTP